MTHESMLTTHGLRLRTHLPLTTRHSQLTTHHPPLTTHHSPLNTRMRTSPGRQETRRKTGISRWLDGGKHRNIRAVRNGNQLYYIQKERMARGLCYRNWDGQCTDVEDDQWEVIGTGGKQKGAENSARPWNPCQEWRACRRNEI